MLMSGLLLCSLFKLFGSNSNSNSNSSLNSAGTYKAIVTERNVRNHSEISVYPLS